MYIRKILMRTLNAIFICLIIGCSSTSETTNLRLETQESGEPKTFKSIIFDNNTFQKVKVLPIEGLTGARQVTLTNAMAKALQNNTEITQILQNKTSKMIKLAGKISIEEERDNIIWLKIHWSLLTHNNKKFAAHTGKVIVDATQWELASNEAINLITDATSPNIFNMIQKYFRATTETNKIANRAGAPDTKTSASSQHFLQNPAPEDKRPALVPLNVKNTLLYVHPVKGAPGDGNLSLTAAIKLALKADQLSLTNNEEASDFIIQGNVLVEESSNDQQIVEISWTVTKKDGEEIGKAVQKNKVPAGSLNAKWGILSDLISDAAVFGIAKLCQLPQNHKMIDNPN